MSGAVTPRATYRLQLNKDFRFADAANLAPYLRQLGISHVYLSPILRARSGSMHGYDTVDHAEINPEIGTLAEFREMAGRLRVEGLGIVLDIVPNHMGVGGSDNAYWLDVLEYGPQSRFANWFDIDWDGPTPALKGKLLVPFLGVPLGEAIRDGALELRREAGKWAIWAHDTHKLPLAPESYGLVPKGEPTAEQWLRLLAAQHWRLAAFDTGDDEINYRRFFIVSDLAAIRIEDDAVFEHVHRLPLQLVEEGLIQGLRIDHIDGLRDPLGYLEKLRARVGDPVWIIVEKILAEDELLPDDWPVEGTSGYEFAATVTPLLVDPQGEAPLDRLHREIGGTGETPAEIERTAKFRVMDHELAAELRALGWRLKRLADAERPNDDLTLYALTRALRAVVAEMPVYRTYLRNGQPSIADGRALTRAFAAARAQHPDLAPRAFDFVEAVLRGESRAADGRDLMLRVQQFTGPVMAKGLEDTALYQFNRLVALNDVGERPAPFHLPITRFHATMAARARRMPGSMLGSSTHDSKRGEDARCRIAALSGHAEAWSAAVPEWLRQLEQQGAPKLHPDDAYLFVQLLLGAWGSGDLAARLTGAMTKSLREARLRTHWINPDAAYEVDVVDFVHVALEQGDNPFLASFAAFAEAMGRHGALNGLIETVLKLTLPGVPDIYQGAEVWSQGLVDPDNRRPVDFGRNEGLMAQANASLDELMTHWQDGAVKQALIARLLAARQAHPQLFAEGSYEPVTAIGNDEDSVCAFTRRHGADALFVAVRLYPWRPAAATNFVLPPAGAGRRWRDLLDGGNQAESTLPFVVYGDFEA